MGNPFLINLFLAVGFSAVMGQLNLSGLLIGFAVGYLALWITRPLHAKTGYFKRLPRILRLFVYFIRQLIISNFRVLWDIITPRHRSRPGIISVDLDAETDLEILLVANLISLTPGTLSLDISDDRKQLYVHVMYLDDVNVAQADIKNGLEKRVLEALR